jgi:hypothetical protein
MGRDVCGICWCPYDEEGKCGCENVKVINPAGALRLAEELESFPLAAADHAADELRRLSAEVDAKDALLRQALKVLTGPTCHQSKEWQELVEALVERFGEPT